MPTPAEDVIKLTDLFRPYVSMFFFAPSDNLSPQSLRFNGTAAFVDTSVKKIVVTNAHVYRRFKELKQSEPSLSMFLTGSVPNKVLELREEYLIDEGGKHVDVAVFSFPKPEQVNDIGKEYFNAVPWPPKRPAPGVTATILGFQGTHRRPTDDSLKISLTLIRDNISASSDRHLTLVDEDAARISVKVNPNLDDLGPLGGMSGSPVFIMGEDGYACIVGFLYETGEGAGATIFAVHADLITKEGKVDYGCVT